VPLKMINELRELLGVEFDDPGYVDMFNDLHRRWENRAYVLIDPNRTQLSGRNYAGFHDCERPVSAGEAIRVFEAEDAIVAEAVVDHVDLARDLVYLTITDTKGWRDTEGEERERLATLDELIHDRNRRERERLLKT